MSTTTATHYVNSKENISKCKSVIEFTKQNVILLPIYSQFIKRSSLYKIIGRSMRYDFPNNAFTRSQMYNCTCALLSQYSFVLQTTVLSCILLTYSHKIRFCMACSPTFIVVAGRILPSVRGHKLLSLVLNAFKKRTVIHVCETSSHT